MIHRQISIKLQEEDYLRLDKMAKVMHRNKHAIAVTAITDTLNMIENRGCERVPLLVVQARTALDYAQTAPALPNTPVTSPKDARKTEEKGQGKNTAETKSKPVSPRAP